MQNQEFFKSANILPQKFAVQPLPKTKSVETSVSEKTVEDDLLKIIRDGFAEMREEKAATGDSMQNKHLFKLI